MNSKSRHSRSFCTLDNPRCNHPEHSIVPFVATQDSGEDDCSSCSTRSSLLPLTVPQKKPQTKTAKAPSSTSSCSPPNVQITATGKSMTLMLSHAGKSQLITLPTDQLDQNKKYKATFTVKKIETFSPENPYKKSSTQEDDN